MDHPTAYQIRNVRNLRAYWDSVDPNTVVPNLRYFHEGWKSCLAGHAERAFRGTRDLDMIRILDACGVTDQAKRTTAWMLHRDALSWLEVTYGEVSTDDSSPYLLFHPSFSSKLSAYEEAKARLDAWLSKFDVLTKIQVYAHE